MMILPVWKKSSTDQLWKQYLYLSKQPQIDWRNLVTWFCCLWQNNLSHCPRAEIPRLRQLPFVQLEQLESQNDFCNVSSSIEWKSNRTSYKIINWVFDVQWWFNKVWDAPEDRLLRIASGITNNIYEDFWDNGVFNRTYINIKMIPMTIAIANDRSAVK